MCSSAAAIRDDNNIFLKLFEWRRNMRFTQLRSFAIYIFSCFYHSFAGNNNERENNEFLVKLESSSKVGKT